MHVAVIPDGNRRWAKKNNKSLEEGYEAGILKFAEFIKWSIELNVQEITGWGMSYDNYKNRGIEVWESIKNVIMRYYEKYKDKKDELFSKYPELNDVNLKIYGCFDELDEEQLSKIELINSQLNGTKYKVNILILYNGRIEILNIIKKLKNSQEVSLDDINNNLLIKSSPDIVIRTGGHIRTSGFMPIQTEYSEWFFLDKLWPDFTKEDYISILNNFKMRKRNFGK